MVGEARYRLDIWADEGEIPKKSRTKKKQNLNLALKQHESSKRAAVLQLPVVIPPVEIRNESFAELHAEKHLVECGCNVLRSGRCDTK